jgi:hypothetical protein
VRRSARPKPEETLVNRSGDDPQEEAARPKTLDLGAPSSDAPSVAVAGGPEKATTEGHPPGGEQPRPERPTETYSQDWLVGLLAGVLAASVFLPWYRLGQFTASGWQTGTWGPVIFFLSIGSLALVGLRRAGIRVELPVIESHFHEFVGWASIVMAVLKVRLGPSLPLLVNRRLGHAWGAWVAIGASFVLAFAAGRMSGSAPLVMLPGWHRGRSGRVGAVVLLAVIAGSAVFGFANEYSPGGTLAGPRTNPSAFPSSFPATQPPVLQGKFPKCAGKFPRPQGVKPETAIDGTGTQPCVFTMNATLSQSDVVKFYQQQLKAAGWTFAIERQTKDFTTMSLKSPRCGTLAVTPTPDRKGIRIAVVLQDCPKS